MEIKQEQKVTGGSLWYDMNRNFWFDYLEDPSTFYRKGEPSRYSKDFYYEINQKYKFSGNMSVNESSLFNDVLNNYRRFLCLGYVLNNKAFINGRIKDDLSNYFIKGSEVEILNLLETRYGIYFGYLVGYPQEHKTALKDIFDALSLRHSQIKNYISENKVKTYVEAKKFLLFLILKK